MIKLFGGREVLTNSEFEEIKNQLVDFGEESIANERNLLNL